MSDYPIIENAVLFDKLIAEVQKGLVDNIDWLHHAFGRAQRIVSKTNAKVYLPCVYAGKKEYLCVAPDDKLKNFCFFVIHDPIEYGWNSGQYGSMTAKYSLIFWFDLRTIYPDGSNRNTEALKQDILRALNGKILMRSGSLNVTKIYEQAENIYKGYSLEETDSQFLMHPYAGFRFEGEMFVNETC